MKKICIISVHFASNYIVQSLFTVLMVWRYDYELKNIADNFAISVFVVAFDFFICSILNKKLQEASWIHSLDYILFIPNIVLITYAIVTKTVFESHYWITVVFSSILIDFFIILERSTLKRNRFGKR